MNRLRRHGPAVAESALFSALVVVSVRELGLFLGLVVVSVVSVAVLVVIELGSVALDSYRAAAARGARPTVGGYPSSGRSVHELEPPRARREDGRR